MEINRHNYEMYFLLLVDGELCAQEQETVMAFVHANPDLAVELKALKATVLPDEDQYFFPDKSSLLKQEGTTISSENYETWFCLYVDNELTLSEKEAVELFVLQHPQYQDAFLLMQQTVLPKEEIVFEDKALLYKQERSRKVFYLPSFRIIAIAAALIGVFFSVWFVTQNGNNFRKSTVVASTVPANNVKLSTPSTILTEKKLANDVTENNQPRYMNTPVVTTSVTKERLPVEMSTAATETNTNVPPQIDRSSENTIATSTEANTKINEQPNQLVNAQMVATAPMEEEQKIADQKQAYKEIDTDDNDKSLYVGALEINKDKLRGFFRKAGTIFRSKQRQEEDKTDTSPQRLK